MSNITSIPSAMPRVIPLALVGKMESPTLLSSVYPRMPIILPQQGFGFIPSRTLPISSAVSILAPTPMPTLLEPTYLESITGLASEYATKGMGLVSGFVAGGRKILSQNLFTMNLLDVTAPSGIETVGVSVGTTLAVAVAAAVIALVAYKILAPTKSTNPMDGSFRALTIPGFEQKV